MNNIPVSDSILYDLQEIFAKKEKVKSPCVVCGVSCEYTKLYVCVCLEKLVENQLKKGK